MKVLALETSMGQTSVAVATGGGSTLAHTLPKGGQQAETLLPLVRDIMAEANLSFKELDRIAVCTGPGGFSGVRTGVAAARGLGIAARVPVVGATSFDLMAAEYESHLAHFKGAYGLISPAGTGMFYCQIRDLSHSFVAPITVVGLSNVPEFFKKKAEVIAAPSLDILVQCQLSDVAADVLVRPQASTLSKLASFLDPNVNHPVPCYVRPADAKPQTKVIVLRQGEHGVKGEHGVIADCS